MTFCAFKSISSHDTSIYNGKWQWIILALQNFISTDAIHGCIIWIMELMKFSDLHKHKLLHRQIIIGVRNPKYLCFHSLQYVNTPCVWKYAMFLLDCYLLSTTEPRAITYKWLPINTLFIITQIKNTFIIIMSTKRVFLRTAWLYYSSIAFRCPTTAFLRRNVS